MSICSYTVFIYTFIYCIHIHIGPWQGFLQRPMQLSLLTSPFLPYALVYAFEWWYTLVVNVDLLKLLVKQPKRLLQNFGPSYSKFRTIYGNIADLTRRELKILTRSSTILPFLVLFIIYCKTVTLWLFDLKLLFLCPFVAIEGLLVTPNGTNFTVFKFWFLCTAW